MNEKFSIVTQGDISLLVYTPWWEEGISHGMTLRPFTFGSDEYKPALSMFCQAIGVSLLANPKQTHGDLFFDGRDGKGLAARRAADGSLARFGEFDAIIAPLEQNFVDGRVAYAIATADCVPVVIRGVSGWGLVHAGWRGLANGIIHNVARALGAIREVAIFGCAGGTSYEVGREVIDAIGDSASYRETSANKILLDTAETARNQLTQYISVDRIQTSGICTIIDTRFHSFRRDGSSAGRALTFVTPR